MTLYRFDRFEFDTETAELTRNGRPVGLRPQASRALSLLLQHSGRLVLRERLKEAIWGSTVVEWETGLHQVIRQLRRVLADDPRRPRFIQTVPARGYRFMPPRDEVGSERRSIAVGSRRRDAVFFALGLLALPTLLVLACVLLAA